MYIRKIRINNQNKWYLLYYLHMIRNEYPISIKKLRLALKDYVKNQNDYINLHDNKLEKLNDTLYTYCYQYAHQFKLVNFNLYGFVLPTNFTKIIEDSTENLKNWRDPILRKILIYCDKENNLRILPMIAQQNNCTLAEVIRNINERCRGIVNFKKSILVDGIASILDIYEASELISKNKQGIYSFNKEVFNNSIKCNAWLNYDEFDRKFEWKDLICKYMYIKDKMRKNKINIQIIISALSCDFNTIIGNVVRKLAEIPSQINGKHVYLVQGRLSGSDSIRLSGTLYNAIEIK